LGFKDVFTSVLPPAIRGILTGSTEAWFFATSVAVCMLHAAPLRWRDMALESARRYRFLP